MKKETNNMTIANAIRNRTEVVFEYRSTTDSTDTARRVQPFAVVKDHSNAEFVLAYDVVKQGYRTYRTDSIQNLQETATTFDATQLNTSVDGRWKEVLVKI
jgi:predicted DNA-binding transcriptional regulator YafY